MKVLENRLESLGDSHCTFLIEEEVLHISIQIEYICFFQSSAVLDKCPEY
jgi:hypothetical protein